MTKTGSTTQVHLFSGWKGHERDPVIGEVYTRGNVSIHFDHAEKLYAEWTAPTCIISDGPYGVSGFPGDTHKAESLAEWYEPHIKAWSKYATPETTLWFWGTEVGWATVHPMLISNGWEYRCCNIWDKGLGHVAGNANTQTLRQFPVVTEVCVHYVKAALFKVGEQSLTMQDWLRHEWRRTGLPSGWQTKPVGFSMLPPASTSRLTTFGITRRRRPL